MKKFAFAAIAALLSFVVSATDWTYDSGVITDGAWKFNATVNGTSLTVGLPVVADCPTSVTALDFSKPVTSLDGATTYTIYRLNCNIRNFNSGSLRNYVGELTMPGEGLVSIGGSAFGQCPNATGELVFPSTLTTLEGAAFYNSPNLFFDATKLPEGLVDIGVQVFTNTKLYGDLRLPNVSTDDWRDTFLGTKITSVYLGPGVRGLWGANGQGPFQNCTELTNVVFDAGCSVYFKANTVFNGCTKLKELDLSCATVFEENNGGHFGGCTSLRKITFGPKLTTLGYRTFFNATALKEIVFTGPPPANFGMTYLNGGPSGVVTTLVSKANFNVQNSAGKSWLDYSANGEIHSYGTTFHGDYVSVNPSLRPLIAPDLGIDADCLVSEFSGSWSVDVFVHNGSGALYVLAKDGDGNVVTNLVDAAVVPQSEPYGVVLSNLQFGKAYSLSLLSCVEGVWEEMAPFSTVFNGTVSIERIEDADRGEGKVGKFRIFLADSVTAIDDLEIDYEVGDGTAVSGVDFGTPSGKAVIPAGENSVIVNIGPLPNGETNNKTVELRLTSGHYFIGAEGSATLTIIGSATFGGWLVNATTHIMYNDDWSFAVTADGPDGIIVGGVNTDTNLGPVPQSKKDLDLSRAVIGTDGKVYIITQLGGMFKSATGMRPYVGEITLPGEGLTKIGAQCFLSCSQATGELVFPSTLTEIEFQAFMYDGNLYFDAAKIPAGITALGTQVFESTKLYGDLYLPNLVATDLRSTFRSTRITSIRLGPGVTATDGGYDQGFIQGCSELTNVVFEAENLRLYYSFVFRGCPKLKELDLTMVTKLENNEGNPSYQGGFFNNSGIERIRFSSKLQKLSKNVFEGANNLKEVIFTGPPPETFFTPYIDYVSQCVTTTVYKANYKMTNGVGKCWRDYATVGFSAVAQPLIRITSMLLPRCVRSSRRTLFPD